MNPLSSTSLSFTLLLDLFLRREEREREREEEKEDCCGVRNFISYVLCAASPSLLRDRRLFFARVLIFTGCRRGYWGYKAANWGYKAANASEEKSWWWQPHFVLFAHPRNYEDLSVCTSEFERLN